MSVYGEGGVLRPQEGCTCRCLLPCSLYPLQDIHTESVNSNTFIVPSVPMDENKADHPFLRHVEKDVLIPKMIREKARELCADKVEAFTSCCKESGILMVVKCREENAALKECLTDHYKDPALYEECKQEYLKEREEFRRTGIPSKKREQKVPAST
ncbi:COX assembly mitochondrial protein homolog [Bombina bombina]|uniref:COX assembly mitochondrial protein homolog n=1 Tax=Bombina bombina TaxID=8345 RepID=UPI00235A4A37|nr:COX assembly mitochondrial protein homolog [Bombina bombina]